MVIKFEEFELSNGLHCILHRDSRNPFFCLQIGYKIGSKDEIDSKRGIAHLFEHLMFQGSAYVKKNEHFGIVQKSGGSCNAFTSFDITSYYDILPSNKLETALWLESDRMLSLDLSDINVQNQKEVVIEEKKTSYDNVPYGSFLEALCRELFPESRYSVPVIGIENDINSISTNEALDFHSKYYVPPNAVLVLAGDFHESEAKEQIEKYFGGIHKSVRPPLVNDNAGKIFNKEIEIEDNVTLPAIQICYRIPKLGTYEEYTLEFFTDILANGESSRLNKKLVYDMKILRSVNAQKIQLENSGVLYIRALAYPDSDLNVIEEIIDKEIRNIAMNGITDDEFNKVKNCIQYSKITSHLRVSYISLELMYNHLLYGNAGMINSKINKYMCITKLQVTESVQKFLIDTPKITIRFIPKKDTGKDTANTTDA